jgi:hypothetical protein
VGWAVWAGVGWAGRQAKAGGVGRPAGPSGLNSKEEFFSNKNLDFEFTKAWEICRRRFGRNFDMRIFLNSSRLLKNFRKI